MQWNPWTTNDEIFMPVTMQQFEDLTNEILVEVNKITSPHNLDANYMASILMKTIHHYEHNIGIVKKSDLLCSCINIISCHVTFHAVEEIQKKLNIEADNESDDGLAPIIPITGESNSEQH